MSYLINCGNHYYYIYMNGFGLTWQRAAKKAVVVFVELLLFECASDLWLCLCLDLLSGAVYCIVSDLRKWFEDERLSKFRFGSNVNKMDVHTRNSIWIPSMMVRKRYLLNVIIMRIYAKIQGCVSHPCCTRIGSIVMCFLAWRVGCCPLNCKSYRLI